MSAKCRPKWDEDEDYIEKVIGYWTARLIGNWRLTDGEREDLMQDFRTDLIGRLPAFDSTKASRRTFISRIVEHRFNSIIAERTAGVRDVRNEAGSLDRPVDRNQPEGRTRVDCLSNDTYHLRVSGRISTDVDTSDLRIDLETILAHLPPSERIVWGRLYEGESVSEIARELGLHRSTLYERIKVIRQRLQRAGYGRKNPSDTSPTVPVSNRRNESPSSASGETNPEGGTP